MCCRYVSLINLDKRGISQYKPFADLSVSVIISLRWLQLRHLLHNRDKFKMQTKSPDRKNTKSPFSQKLNL